MHKLLILFAMAAVLCLSEAKVFDRCGLVNELRRQGLPEDQMGNWVCLIEHESGGNTGATNTNTDGSTDYGLFQINNQYWCSESGDPGKDCNITCDELLSDDITAAVQCARVIYNRHAFQAWYGWINYCQSGLPDISSC